MRGLSKVAAAVLLAGAGSIPAGHAAFVSAVGNVCAGTMTWEFSPPLSENASTGAVTQRWSGVCGLAVVGATTSPPDAGEFHSLFGFESTSTGGYSGDCALATVSVDGTAHLLVGGVVAVERDLNVAWPGAGVSSVTPDQPCPISSVTGDRIVSSAAVNAS